jgi:hypothetical protein
VVLVFIGYRRLAEVQMTETVLKCTFVLFFVLSLSSLVHAQAVEHAPTAEQCRADNAVWRDAGVAKIKAGGRPWPDVVMPTLMDMMHEMDECAHVDRPNRDDYADTANLLLAEAELRLQNFLIRHDLLYMFTKEDKAGER